MVKQQFALDYIDVAKRIVDFRAKHPEGSLQPANPNEPYKIESIDGVTYIVVVAAAYRSPDDPRPGIGMAYELFPGRTPYTRGSELQNAETSAWGRAIVAAMAGDTKKGIASAEEVRNRREEQAADSGSRALEKSGSSKLFDDKAAEEIRVQITGASSSEDLDAVTQRIIDLKREGRLSPDAIFSLQKVWKDRKSHIAIDDVKRQIALVDTQSDYDKVMSVISGFDPNMRTGLEKLLDDHLQAVLVS